MEDEVLKNKDDEEYVVTSESDEQAKESNIVIPPSLETSKTTVKKTLPSKKKFGRGARKSMAFNNLLALTQGGGDGDLEHDELPEPSTIPTNDFLDASLIPPERELRDFDTFISDRQSDIESNRLQHIDDDVSQEKDSITKTSPDVETMDKLHSKDIASINYLPLGSLDDSLVPMENPFRYTNTNNLSNRTSSIIEEMALVSSDASDVMTMSLNTKMLELMIGLTQVQTKTEAQVDSVSERMKQEEKNTEILLKYFLQSQLETQRTLEEMKTMALKSRRLGSSNRVTIAGEIQEEQEEEEEEYNGDIDAGGSNLGEWKRRVGELSSKLQAVEQDLIKSEKENTELRHVLEKSKQKSKSQDSQLASLNTNYAQALTASKTHWETMILEREKALLKWKQQYDNLLDENKRLETICMRATHQARTGQLLENANRTLISLNSGKLMKVGGDGGMDGTRDHSLLNSMGQQSLTTMETLKRANKLSGHVNESIFECLTSKKTTDEQ